ncbi:MULTISPECIES: DUF4336 domain-containing protein [Vibrio]|uniref:DUF4336 domain-containing protein n=1 Tax=Vibrio proteolyticus NBRC 13287 TaxID=1219065 RepID=U3BK93_VIBPR|nr:MULTISPECIES: DUF4336 domain-containing protein [Vibrio]NAW58864.1 DUF4336 domain-containing protein [Vibrio sp. V36_P2S2PM302]NAX26505.1 DUF4336 domain-containing protein [Vibrio sp. V38_P2S17PM301]NAX31385.1 DUF4336 domain-containing protein [Vibrio sp. V37_P2S8PM304]GAD67043.1 hypothetical protein VPR01S_06_00600 [Vibrio proteolyticus NBRC 13287]
MEALGKDIWIVEGGTVPFFSLPYSTRMTVIRLQDGRLWIHSPIKLTLSLKAQIEALGEVAYLIGPNHLHHLFIEDWQRAYPLAQTYATAELKNKREDLFFNGVLESSSAMPWSSEIRQLLFTGSRAMQECVFYHPESGVLIVTDLIENFNPTVFKPWQRAIARGVGILAPNGKMPLDWRMSFMFSKPQAREHLATILEWQPRMIVMAHGEIIRQQAEGFLHRSFSWLDLNCSH